MQTVCEEKRHGGFTWQGRPGGVVEYQYTRKKIDKIPQIPPNIPKNRSSGHCRMSRSADVNLCIHVRNTEVHGS